MKGWDDLERDPVSRVFRLAMGSEVREVTEETVIATIAGDDLENLRAAEAWEQVAEVFRKGVVRQGIVYEWNLFRRVLRITPLPRADEVERIAELYSTSTPHEIERRIASLEGRQFENFLHELLSRMPQFSGVYLTPIAHDGGVDIGGNYTPDPHGPKWRLLGQAKRVTGAVDSAQARDFIGALDISRENKVVGLYICTAGFSGPALNAFRLSRFQILTWALPELKHHVLASAVGVQRVRLELDVPDETFWEEIRGVKAG